MTEDEIGEMSKAQKDRLAASIKRLRARLGLTQEQFASKLGVSWSTVSRWENGRGRPSPLAMRQIEDLKTRAGDERKE